MIKLLFRLAFSGGLPSIIAFVMFVSAAGFTWLKIHDYNIKEAVIQEFNQQQEQLVEQKQEQFKQQTVVINDDASRIRDEIAKSKQQDHQQIDTIEKQASVEVKKDIPSSDYLKSIIKQLSQIYGSSK